MPDCRSEGAFLFPLFLSWWRASLDAVVLRRCAKQKNMFGRLTSVEHPSRFRPSRELSGCFPAGDAKVKPLQWSGTRHEAGRGKEKMRAYGGRGWGDSRRAAGISYH